MPSYKIPYQPRRRPETGCIPNLKALEADNIISRKMYSCIPPKVEYRLTEKGESLLPILRELTVGVRVCLRSGGDALGRLWAEESAADIKMIYLQSGCCFFTLTLRRNHKIKIG
ncbi:MAG: winged helix-turn-helix transcriptional regulator [Paramuribaculum sp.]